MATQIVISYNDYINVGDSFIILWADKGNAMPTLSGNTHYVVFNDLPGPNEIQTKDPTTLMMTGNTDLSSVSDAVGDTTVQNLLDWGTTRQIEIETAQLHHDEAYTTAWVAWQDAGNTPETFVWDKTWRDYDPNYS